MDRVPQEMSVKAGNCYSAASVADNNCTIKHALIDLTYIRILANFVERYLTNDLSQPPRIRLKALFLRLITLSLYRPEHGCNSLNDLKYITSCDIS